MSAVLGVEGGGSHTHAVVADAGGALLGLGASRDSSNWEDVGFEAAGGAIRSCVRTALSAAGVKPVDVDASVFSLAGVDFPTDPLLMDGIPRAVGLTGPARIINDAFASLRAGTDDPFGVVVVAGTGSVVVGRSPDGQEFRTLGLGPTYGDYGGSTEVSEAAVTAVAAAFLDRGPPTLLTDLLCQATDSPGVLEFLEAAGRGRIDLTLFAPLITRAATEGDPVAAEILAHAGSALGSTAVHVIRQLAMESSTFDLVLAGSMFRGARPEFVEGVTRTVVAEAPAATPKVLRCPAVVGAGLLAMELAGVLVQAGVRDRLSEEVASGFGVSPA
jgi:N-acetylglucosamine kinase-like BadF-type ATPase